VTRTHRSLPPRRLLAVAAALALIGAQAEAGTGTTRRHRTVETGDTPRVCPLGTFVCPPRPDNFALCRPNALLEFYDPALPQDTRLRETADTHAAAEHVDSSNQAVYHFAGNVKITRADQQLQADRVDYNDETTDYDARGNVRVQAAGELFAADHVQGNTDASRGVADGHLRYQMLDSHGNGTADRVHMLDAEHSRYSRVSYSTCDIGHHLWEIRARELTINKETGRGVARGATMRFAHVPFLYLPWLSFPVDNRRMSGFLYPTFGHTSRGGYMFSVPYYLNLAPNYDATLEPRLYSKRGPMLAGQTRYLLPGSSGTLDFEYLDSDRFDDRTLSPTATDTQGNKRWLVRLNDSIALWPGWSIGTSINRASDRNYLRDFGSDLYTVATGTLTSSSYLRGSGNWWNASFGADYYQNVDPSLPDSVVQYKRWPRATLGLDIPLNRWLEVGLDSEAVAFRKDDVVEGDRLDLYPYLGADFQGAAWFVRPKLAWRYTAYQLDRGYQDYGFHGPLAQGQASPFTDRTPSRSLPIASIDSGLIFERDTSLFGEHYTQTLEPRLYYLYVPYRDQGNLPLFDTTLMSFDYWQLFSPNQYSGADRQMNANNLSAAVTTRLLDDSGVERLSMSFGQIRYFTPQKVQLPGVPVTDWSGSDYVVELGTQLSDQWRLNSSYQWNPHSRQTDMGSLQLQRRIGLDGVLNFSYRFRRNLLEQYDASVVYPVSARWRLLGHWTYSVRDRRTVEAMAGLQYEGCCVRVSVLGRHFVRGYDGLVTSTTTANPGTNNAIMFELEFKGMGAFNGQAESYLRRGILGYQ
jgi:LPS-assembly protein